MSSPAPLEEIVLRPARAVLESACQPYEEPSTREECNLRILECASAELGGVGLSVFADKWTPLDGVAPDGIAFAARDLLVRLRALNMHPAFALAALSQPRVAESARRSKGVYYTDTRLARYLASSIPWKDRSNYRIIDPASGTGVLLVAAVLEITNRTSASVEGLLSEAICASDLSAKALRGVFLSLASLTRSRNALEQLAYRLRTQDSLAMGSAAWADVTADGFDAVIGNPPWEKLKVTRHEWLRANGVKRHYGDEYPSVQNPGQMTHSQSALGNYVAMVSGRYEHQGRGEHDLYKLFLELALQMVRPGGHVALLLPAGLIRSQGTFALRSLLFERSADLDVTVFENRAKYFAIDTRFKFLALHARINGHQPASSLHLSVPHRDDDCARRCSTVVVNCSSLKAIRPDLSIPEVRTREEWSIFKGFAAKGRPFGASDGIWQPVFMREVDMTRDRSHFCRVQGKRALPLIEGRMVHQFRFGAKRYVSGTGRRALWDPSEVDDPRLLQPQFYFPEEDLPPHVRERAFLDRVGFCDITGQTNERTMLASWIPRGVVCGNKVPTLVFAGDRQLRVAYLWLAIVNSIPFDWLLRRVVTTTVNYFLLLDLPMPVCSPESQSGLRLIELSRQLTAGRDLDAWERSEMRAEIDWRVLGQFSHDAKTLKTLLDDFPLLDRSQPALPGETRSTVTKDLTLLRAAENLGGASSTDMRKWSDRVLRARSLGATAYVPSHLAEGD